MKLFKKEALASTLSAGRDILKLWLAFGCVLAVLVGCVLAVAVWAISDDGVDKLTSQHQQFEKEMVANEARVTELSKQVAALNTAIEKLNTERDERMAREARAIAADNKTSRGGVSRTIRVEATAYNPNDPNQTSGTGLAADGNPAIPHHTIAVDPNVIPMGTRIRVPGWGTGVAHDTGSAIKGNIIDLAVPDNATAYRWGRRMVDIEVLPN